MSRARWRTRLLLAAAAGGAVVPIAGWALTAQAQPATTATATGCVAHITTYAFHPERVPAGDKAKLVLKVRDCTDGAVKVSLVQFGGGPGCPVLDPVSQSATLHPGRVYTRTQEWTAPVCAGPLQLTIRVDRQSTGMQLATRTASLSIETP
jgi:hypothetical protein